MTALSDALLKQIAESPNRCYSHEGREMAAELIERRAKEKAVMTSAAYNPYGAIFP